MAATIAVPGNTWTRLPGTEWEVLQDSTETVFLGNDDAVVHIRRVAQVPRVWGPRPPVDPCSEIDQIFDVQSANGGGITR